MKQIIIYTCVFGGYDDLNEPLITDDRFEYIYFSNMPVHKKNSKWQYRHIDNEEMDNLYLSRYVKMLPHLFFTTNDYSVYVDAKIQIENDEFYKMILEWVGRETKWAGFRHPERDCCYVEAEACVRQVRSPYFIVKKQMSFYRKSGFPKNFGLTENCVLLRKHNDQHVMAVDEEWWNDFVKFGSRRDQLCLPFVFWKNSFEYDIMYGKDVPSWNFPGIKGLVHPNTKRLNWIEMKLCGLRNYFRRYRAAFYLYVFGKFDN